MNNSANLAVLSIRPKLWTDAHLAAFAIAGNQRVVTFDGDFEGFSGLNLLLLQSE